ncbi:hypothetical protein CRM22_009042 [Opisthorchis felineus]|uniref:Presequence protease, mitochondrial n=1 Tax=Opisthorchis felineus TaxID=147828 RepID=A0A4S2LFH6_OPIFE|nr:hypothetical protein CRM22_009042 [Opisthorchis felineus]
MKADKLVHGFLLKRSFEVPEFRLLVAELLHEKTGAKYYHLRRDDSNKTYSVQFRTTPRDNSGVSHILEHTVLCGSRKYPVRDPFFKMLHRSQASFMNALTANDWTMYPFSTMNDKDFQNLLSVYTDAVFNPKLNELDFMQEGWRLEPKDLMNPSSELRIKGVVFNEMKGVFSNSLNRFGQAVQNNLFPHTYGFVSGGHPESIPSLTWDALKAFHSSCYHPSNALFYTYGDANLDWCLEFLDTEYLRHYDAIKLDNKVHLEPAWTEPRTVNLTSEADPMAPDPDRQCIVSLSCRLGDILETYPNFVCGIVSKLLIDGDNAPLYRELIESGYGLDWAGGICGVDQSTRTTSFHVGVQGVKSDQLNDFSGRTREVLTKVVRDGFPKERVEATLHQYELAVRHESARFGLNLIFGLSHGLNHDADLQEMLQIEKIIQRFRADLEARPTMLQDIVQQYFLDNKHSLLTTMQPDESWKAEQTKGNETLLSKLTESLTDADRQVWAQKSQKLLEQQQLEEDLSCLPCLSLLDIPMECRPESFTMTQTNGCTVQLNEAPTNGIVYFHGLADLSSLPTDLIIYVPLFCTLFPRLGAGDLIYSEMDQAIDLHTGGLNVTTHVTPSLPTLEVPDKSLMMPTTRPSVHLSGYCLTSKLPNFFELWSKLLQTPDWLDKQRLMTLILMSASGDWSANVVADSAHHFAMRRAAANLSASARITELWDGLEQASLVKRIASKLGKDNMESDNVLTDLTQRMLSIWKHIIQPDRLKFSLHGESGGLSSSLPHLEQLVSALSKIPHDNSIPTGAADTLNSLPKLPLNSYFAMPFTVHYTAQAFRAPPYDSPEYASFRVLSHLLTSKYLHREIREKGGAYGGRATAKPEALLFFSYRDPHARRTLDIFRSALDWARSTEFNTQDVDEAKLAVFQELDQPVSAGSRGLRHFLHGIDDNLRQTHRKQLFAVDSTMLRQAAERLSSNVHLAGRTILGPEESADWTLIDEDSDLKWERVVMRD